MKTNTTKYLESGYEKALMIDWLCQFQVTKVARVRLVVETTEARVVCATVNGLAIDGSFVAGDSGWDLAAIDGNGLCDTVLALSMKKDGELSLFVRE